jgi:hypothetical protein
MGQWTLMSVTPSITNRDDVYGHYFAITFKMKYSASLGGSFVESPILEWKETITMIEYGKGTWWHAEFDQFGRLPDSPTFGQWTYRYSLAHTSVTAGNYSAMQPSRLYDKNGAQLPPKTFSKAASTKEAADQVRSYLKKNGGILSVNVTDTPGINKPDDAATDKERILTFDCGLKGMGQRVQAVQHLKVVGNVEANWKRECTLGPTSRPFQTHGLNQIPAPADVTRVAPWQSSPGLYM